MWNRFSRKKLSVFYADAVTDRYVLCKRVCLRAGRILRKVYCNLYFRAVAAGIFAVVWWGVLYPELCFTETTCEQVAVVEGQEVESQQTDYTGILEAAGDEIVIRSRLLEWIEQKIDEKER